MIYRKVPSCLSSRNFKINKKINYFFTYAHPLPQPSPKGEGAMFPHWGNKKGGKNVKNIKIMKIQKDFS